MHPKKSDLAQRKKIPAYKYKLFELLGDCKEKRVLDYGCGWGDFITLLTTDRSIPKEIIAVDSSSDMLAIIKENHATFIDEKIVVPKLVSDPSILSGEKFDKIICHNVLECVNNKLEFINAFHALLNDHAVFILSHHDFDSIIYNNADKALSRNLVHHFSDTQQAWQEHVDGQMGRKIPGLMARSLFHGNVRCETWRIVETEFKEGKYGYQMAENIMEASKNNFNDADRNSWYQDLVSKDKSNDYYFAIDLVIAVYGNIHI